nr:ribonuclease H [Ipomoea batatas]
MISWGINLLGRGTPNSIQEKLDRVLVSGDWRDVFSNAKAWRRPRFENSWGGNPECRKVIGRLGPSLRVTEQAWFAECAMVFDFVEKSMWSIPAACEGGMVPRGDMNRKYFSNVMNAKRRRNRIQGLRGLDGVLETDATKMGKIMVDYFRSLFEVQGGYMWPVLECVDRTITVDKNEALLRPIMHDDVRNALFTMHPDKSPGPDSLSPAFF